jgi:hypothetical protein
LRKTSLDELPQLWNVIRGEMSLVGPRPYLPRESKEIGVSQSEILRVPPGVTGPCQVAGRNQTTLSERVQMDTRYVRDRSAWLDLVLLARTAQTVILRRGAVELSATDDVAREWHRTYSCCARSRRTPIKIKGGYPQERSINPNSRAWTTAWVRSETPSLAMMCSTWFLAVPRLITRSPAI